MPQDLVLDIPALSLRANVVPNSYDAGEHTVEVVVATEKRKLVVNWWDDPFDEVLGMNEGEVRLERLNSGGAVMNAHGRRTHREGGSGLEDQFGVVERSWLAGGELHCLIRFSQAPNIVALGFEHNIATGIFRNISIGYLVYTYRDVTTGDDVRTVKRAVDWEPFELSFLPVPDDYKAGVRSFSTDTHSCTFLENDEDDMAQRKQRKKKPQQQQRGGGGQPPKPTGGARNLDDGAEDDDDDPEGDEHLDEPQGGQRGGGTPAPAADPAAGGDPEPQTGQRGGGTPVDEQVRQALQQERVRAAGIGRAFRAGPMPADIDVDQEIENAISNNHALETVQTRALELIARAQEEGGPTMPSGNTHVVEGQEEGDKRLRGIENALSVRCGQTEITDDGRRAQIEHTDEGRAYRGAKLMRIAEHILSMRGINTHGMSQNELAQRALSSDDLPAVLERVAHRSLRQAYDAAEQTFHDFARRADLPDFRDVKRVQFGSTALSKVSEDGEIKMGKVSDSAETYALATYGKRIPFTRQAMIDDDLGAFDRLVRMFGRAAAETESDIVWALITNNANMSDGNALFSSAHGNLAGSGAAPSVTTLGDARKSMRLQTDLDGQRINVNPRHFRVPAELEVVAQQLVADITPAQSSNVNPFNRGVFSTVKAEPRLDADSTTAWYLFADPDNVDVIEYGYLAGESGPRVERVENSKVLGVELRGYFDFGAGVVDHRGGYKNPGS